MLLKFLNLYLRLSKFSLTVCMHFRDPINLELHLSHFLLKISNFLNQVFFSSFNLFVDLSHVLHAFQSLKEEQG